MAGTRAKMGKYLKGVERTRHGERVRDQAFLGYLSGYGRKKIAEAIFHSDSQGISWQNLVKIAPKRKEFNHDRKAYLKYALQDIAAHAEKNDPPLRLDLSKPDAIRLLPTASQRTPEPLKIRDRKPASMHRREQATKVRKYPAGEGREHKRLKEWVAKNPHVLVITSSSKCEIEYGFISGDRADLVFAHRKAMYTIVEVETTDALPGAHQLIKYRALLCAQKGLQLSASKVKGVLVAWAIPRDVKRFCKKYELEVWEHRPTE